MRRPTYGAPLNPASDRAGDGINDRETPEEDVMWMRDAEYRRLVEALEWSRRVFDASEQDVGETLRDALRVTASMARTAQIPPVDEGRLAPDGLRMAAILLFCGDGLEDPDRS